MEPLNPLTCDIRDLKRLAGQHGISCYIGTGGRLIIRPYRGTAVDVHAACRARHDELRDHLTETRPAPFDPDKAADEAAWRVCRMPHEALCNLAIHHLNRWLALADAGLLTYEPPRGDDGLVHDERPEREPQRPARRKSPRSVLQNDRVVFE